jgi:hypothetical protein
LGKGAYAQEESKIVVNVPFEFVAAGETLPAGKYNVSRISPDSKPGLVISTFGKSAFVLPVAFDGIPADQAKLDFEHVGDKYFLSAIKTPAGIYTIATPRPMTKVAEVKDHTAMSSSGTH